MLLTFWLACADPVVAPHHPTDRPWIGPERIELPAPLQFREHSPELADPTQAEIVEDLAVILKNHPEILEIEIHGDAAPLEAQREPDLVKFRIQTLEANLRSRGVEASRTITTSAVSETPGVSFRIRRGLTEDHVAFWPSLNFFPTTADFGPENDRPLGDVLAVLERKPELKLDVVVTGAPDGPQALTPELEMRRAERLIRWLTGHGVAAERLRAVSGEAGPTWVPGDDVRFAVQR